MARPKQLADAALSPRERAIMHVLWQEGAVTAEQVRAALSIRLSNSSVRTFLRILERKGCVAHAKQGRAFVFQARLSRDRAVGQAVDDLLDGYFDGSFEALMRWWRTKESAGPRRERRTRRRTRRPSKPAPMSEVSPPDIPPTTDSPETTEPWLL